MLLPSTPPCSPPNFDITASSLLSETTELLSISQNLRNEIISSVESTTAKFSNVLRPLIDQENAGLSRLKVLTLLAAVSEDPAIRDASRVAEKLVLESDAEALLSKGIARLVAAVFKSWTDGKEQLDAEDQYFLQRKYGEYLRNGLGMEEENERGRYLQLLAELNSLLASARKTLSEAEDGVWFSNDDLEGVSVAIMQSIKHLPNADLFGEDLLCSFLKGHYVPVMKQCTRASSRKKLYLAKQNQFKSNVGRLERILETRDEIAKSLGFNNHAELKLEENMSENVGDTEKQLSEWRKRLQPNAQAEIQKLLNVKRNMLNPTKLKGVDNPEKLYFWDWSFYSNIQKKVEFSVNTEKVSQYFEVMHTLQGMLSIFEKLFGMHFSQTEGSVWQKDVLVYTVWDSESQGGCFLGHFFLDLFAREGKYGGAHHAMIQPGYTDRNGIRHYPADALICSFLKIAGQPTLLMMNEVRTMFHELGHCIHFLVSKGRYGLYPSRDFIEIPSIMLENWIWVPEVLKNLGRHYSYLNEDFKIFWEENGGLEREERLSDTLIQDLVRTKNLNGAHNMLSQLHLAMFDLTIHTLPARGTTSEMNTTILWNKMKREIIGLEDDDETNSSIGQAGFPHIYRKYDASYFAYPLSKVWGADLYASTFASDPMDPAAGRRYRKRVLEPGAGVPEAETLRNFLGRKLNVEAYFTELLGITEQIQ